MNFAEEVPAFTVTELGTVAFALLLVSSTVVLVAAVALKVTVQLEATGGVTADGLHAKDKLDVALEFNVTVNTFDAEPSLAVITA